MIAKNQIKNHAQEGEKKIAILSDGGGWHGYAKIHKLICNSAGIILRGKKKRNQLKLETSKKGKIQPVNNSNCRGRARSWEKKAHFQRSTSGGFHYYVGGGRQGLDGSRWF